MIGVYDRDISQYTALRYTRLYRDGPKGNLFNVTVMSRWLLVAFVQTIVILWVCLYVVPEKGTIQSMELAEFGWYSMSVTIFVCNIQLFHAIEMWFWWTGFTMVLCSLLAFPLLYGIMGHGWGLIATEDSPFPLQAFQNVNYWMGLSLTLACVLLPESFLKATNRRFYTTFHDLVQEVEQINWFSKQMCVAKDNEELLPVHKKLDALDRMLWKVETKGEGESKEDHGTGHGFSMDDATSMVKGDTFRNRQERFGKNIPGLVQEHNIERRSSFESKPRPTEGSDEGNGIVHRRSI